MKKLLYLFAIIFLGVFSSCSSDDDHYTPPQIETLNYSTSVISNGNIIVKLQCYATLKNNTNNDLVVSVGFIYNFPKTNTSCSAQSKTRFTIKANSTQEIEFESSLATECYKDKPDEVKVYIK